MTRKRFFSLVLVFVVALSMTLAGCGSNAGQTNTPAPSASASEPAPASESASPSATATADTSPIEFSIFIDHSWFWMDSWGGRPVDDEITKRTGVSFKVTRATDDQQLPVLVASNNLPDFVYAGRYFKELSNDNTCYDIGGLISKYAPDFNPPKEQTLSALTADNKYYYLINFWKTQKDFEDPHFLPGVGTQGFNFRTDIMQALGNPAFNTLDDLVNVLTQVKEKYPDMVPLALGPEGGRYETLINQSKVGSLANLPDGSWKYYATTDEYKNGMKFINQLAQKGLLKPDMFTLKYDQYIAEAQNGNVFMWTDDAANISLYNQTFQTNGVNASTSMKQGSSFYGDKAAKEIDPNGGWSGTFITKNNKNPERAIKFLQWASSDEAGKLVGWGLEGQQYNMDAQGYPVLTPDTSASWAKDYDATVLQSGVGAWFFGTRAWYESVRTYDPNGNKALTDYLLNYKNTSMVLRPECATLSPDPNTDEMTILGNLDNLVTTMYPRIIFAKDDAEFESVYNELQTQLQSNGSDKYNEWAAGKWAQIKKNYGIN